MRCHGVEFPLVEPLCSGHGQSIQPFCVWIGLPSHRPLGGFCFAASTSASCTGPPYIFTYFNETDESTFSNILILPKESCVVGRFSIPGEGLRAVHQIDSPFKYFLLTRSRPRTPCGQVNRCSLSQKPHKAFSDKDYESKNDKRGCYADA